jgi:fatty acid desaturase
LADNHASNVGGHRKSGISVKPGNPGSPHLPSIVSDTGQRWIDFRRTLTPHYGMVWRDIAIGYLFVALGLLGVMAIQATTESLPTAILAAFPVVIWIGYWLHALFLFGHEAAHSNLAPTRKQNDRLGDWFVWVLFGSTTKNYRRTHMTHHVHLGDHHDTETTYHLCLSVLNMVKALTGLHILEVLLRRATASSERSAREGRPRKGTAAGVLASVRSALLHAAVVGSLWFTGFPVAALSWVAAVGCVFPLFATVRTIVEHRRADAGCDVDFLIELHGPVNRLFGNGLISRYFGSAGFNRHLLHHWDPAISYTRFDDMERFLRTTPLAVELEASRTTYGAAVRMLMAEAWRG